MQLNIRSILSHQSELKHLLHILVQRNSRIDALLLCEIFLMKFTEKLMNVPDYTLISNNRTHSKGGGVAILLRSDISFKKRNDLSVLLEKEVESMYIQITAKNGTQIILGSLYRSRNTDENALINHLGKTINKIKSRNNKMELIMQMDHNLDLLKCDIHWPTEQFLDLLVDNEQWPTITRPPRITQGSVTLIDNIFISSKLHQNFDSMVILDNISDHLPTVVLLKHSKLCDKTAIELQSRDLSDTKLTQIREKLNQQDWNGVLNSEDCNQNFNTFCHIVETKLNEIAPLKMMRISGKWCFQEPWLPTELETASRTCRKLYQNTPMKNCTEETLSNYKNYRNQYNRLK